MTSDLREYPHRESQPLPEADRLIEILRIRLLDVGDPSSALVARPDLKRDPHQFAPETLEVAARRLNELRDELTASHVEKILEAIKIAGRSFSSTSSELSDLWVWCQSHSQGGAQKK